MARGYSLIVFVVLALATPALAAETHDDLGIHDIMVPEQPAHSAKHKARHRAKPAVERRREQDAEPSRENTHETKAAHKRGVPRGSSTVVYPIPLPPPLHYVPPASHPVVTNPPPVPPPIVVPETGRVLPNFPSAVGAGPNGTESFQDRATRCVHQAGAYGAAAGNRNAYIGGCVNQ